MEMCGRRKTIKGRRSGFIITQEESFPMGKQTLEEKLPNGNEIIRMLV